MVDASQSVTPEALGSQTVGPYYAIGLDYLLSEALAGPGAAGRHLSLSGTVFDADGEPVPDAILELWQASPDGTYNQHAYDPTPSSDRFQGFARLSTHDNGRFRVRTVAPGQVPFGDGRLQAPHIVVLLFMRGLMRHLVTRIYLPQDPHNEHDPVLASVPAARRATLIARSSGPNGADLLWDIHLQGEEETVFFSC